MGDSSLLKQLGAPAVLREVRERERRLCWVVVCVTVCLVEHPLSFSFSTVIDRSYMPLYSIHPLITFLPFPFILNTFRHSCSLLVSCRHLFHFSYFKWQVLDSYVSPFISSQENKMKRRIAPTAAASAAGFNRSLTAWLLHPSRLHATCNGDVDKVYCSRD